MEVKQWDPNNMTIRYPPYCKYVIEDDSGIFVVRSLDGFWIYQYSHYLSARENRKRFKEMEKQEEKGREKYYGKYSEDMEIITTA